MSHDPNAILDDWIAGAWTKPDGTHVVGRLWSPDAEYRWRRYLDHWFHIHAEDLWEPTGEAIREWAYSLVHWATGQRLGPRSRARAVSVILSFYDHCEHAYGLGPFRLPKRWKIIGVVEEKHPDVYQPWVTDALRTAADRFTGLERARGRSQDISHPSRYRLACYLVLCQLRPKQAMRLDLAGLEPDHDKKILRAKIPLKHHADPAATFNGTLPWPLWRAIEEFMPHRRTAAPYSGPHFGPVLTTRTGGPYDWANFPRLIRDVAATHEDLAEIEAPLRPDWLAHSPSPWGHTREDETEFDDDQEQEHHP